MSRAKISQREAQRLKKRVRELQQKLDAQHRSWTGNWPGHSLTTITPGECTLARVEVARRLGYAVVVVNDGNTLKFFTDKL